MESSEDAIFSKSLEGIIRTWNASAERVYGYTPEDVVGRHVSMLAPPERHAEIEEIMDRIRRGEYVRNFETRRVHKDGSEFSVSITLSPIKSDNGEIIGISTIARDLSSRVRIRSELRRARDQLAIITEGVADGITIQEAPSGRVVYANLAAAKLSGFDSVDSFLNATPEDMGKQFRILTEAGDPFPWDELPGRRALLGEDHPEVVLRFAPRNGPESWSWVKAEPITDDDGNVQFAVNIFRDITMDRLAEDALRYREALLASEMEATTEGILVVGPTGQLVSFNQRFGDMWNMPEKIVPGSSSHDEALDIIESQVADPEGFRRRVQHFRDLPAESGEDQFFLTDGRVIERRTKPLDASDGTRYGRIWFFRDITEQTRTAERQTFLLEASRVLSSSLDYEATLARVAQLSVPILADWSAVDMLDEADGSIQSLALAHTDPQKAEWAKTFQGMNPTTLSDPAGTGAVIRTGEAEIYEDLGPIVAQQVQDPELLDLIQRLQLNSLMVVPLKARGRTFGALTFVWAESGRRYDKADLALAEDLAARAALAIDNSRIYKERSRIARVLQDSLLPPGLPRIDGVEVAARYHASGEGTEVGGDFYDVFEAGTGSWAAAIGDVCGKGPEAAAVMGLVRHALRAAAVGMDSPAEALTVVNETVLAQATGGRFCTICFSRMTRTDKGMRLTLSCGGHPLPFLVRANGEVSAAGKPGTLIGVLSDPELHDVSVEMEPGDALVMYTDGVTDERRDGEEFGEARLKDLLERLGPESAERIASEIEGTVLAFRQAPPQDDIAILVIRMSA